MNLVLTLFDSSTWPDLHQSFQINTVETLPDLPQSPEHDHLVKYAVTFEQLEDFLESYNDINFYIFYAQPECFIADKLQQQFTLVQAGDEWYQQAKQLIAIQRKNKHRIKLLNLHQATGNIEKLIKITCNSGLSVRGDITLSEYQPEFYELMANQYLAQQVQLKQLAERLFASSEPLAQSALLVFDTQKIVQKYHNLLSNNQEKENSNKSLKEDIDREKEESTKLAHQLQKKDMENKEISDENTLLLKQLFKVQDQLERIYIKHEELKTSNYNTACKSHLLKKELSSIKKTVSWKITMPLRMLGKLFRNNRVNFRKLQDDCKLLLSSKYFDAKWYLENNKDVVESGMNPAEHYILYGAKEGRQPGPEFDSESYLEQNPDVVENNMIPLLHFLKHGQYEGRSAPTNSVLSNINNGIK